MSASTPCARALVRETRLPQRWRRSCAKRDKRRAGLRLNACKRSGSDRRTWQMSHPGTLLPTATIGESTAALPRCIRDRTFSAIASAPSTSAPNSRRCFRSTARTFSAINQRCRGPAHGMPSEPERVGPDTGSRKSLSPGGALRARQSCGSWPLETDLLPQAPPVVMLSWGGLTMLW